jgi:hypothetical protein
MAVGECTGSFVTIGVIDHGCRIEHFLDHKEWD